MVVEERVFVDTAKDITASNLVADLVFARREVPFLGAVQSGD